MTTLLEIFYHPRRFDSVQGLPLKFDAAEMLVKNHWDELGKSDKRAIVSFLIKSGKYSNL